MTPTPVIASEAKQSSLRPADRPSEVLPRNSQLLRAGGRAEGQWRQSSSPKGERRPLFKPIDMAHDPERSIGYRSRVAKPIPRPSFLDGLESLGAINGVKRWRSSDGRRLYTWDALHGEIEVFNARGRHLGAIDPLTGEQTKEAVRGRTIDV